MCCTPQLLPTSLLVPEHSGGRSSPPCSKAHLTRTTRFLWPTHPCWMLCPALRLKFMTPPPCHQWSCPPAWDVLMKTSWPWRWWASVQGSLAHTLCLLNQATAPVPHLAALAGALLSLTRVIQCHFEVSVSPIMAFQYGLQLSVWRFRFKFLLK